MAEQLKRQGLKDTKLDPEMLKNVDMLLQMEVLDMQKDWDVVEHLSDKQVDLKNSKLHEAADEEKE